MPSFPAHNSITAYAGIDIGSTLCKGAVVFVRRDSETGGIETSAAESVGPFPTSECMQHGATEQGRPVSIPHYIKMAMMSSDERQPLRESAHLFATYESQWVAAAQDHSVAREMSIVVSTMFSMMQRKVASLKTDLNIFEDVPIKYIFTYPGTWSVGTRQRFVDAVALARQYEKVALSEPSFVTEGVAAAHGVVERNPAWRSSRAHGAGAFLVIDGGGLTIDASVYVRRGPNAQAQKVYIEDSKLSGFLLIDSKFEKCAREQVADYVIPGRDAQNHVIEDCVKSACDQWARKVRDAFPHGEMTGSAKFIWKKMARDRLEHCFDETVLQAVNMVLPWFVVPDHSLRPKVVVFAGGMWQAPYLRTKFQAALRERLGRGPYPLFHDYELNHAIMTVACGAAIWGASPL